MFAALKDDIALWLSVLAFVLSLFATLSGEKRAREERRRTLRAQLSEVLDRLASLQLENAKLMHEARGDITYLQSVGGALAQQNGFLLDQAAYLADQIPALVTTYEFNTIAGASFASGNVLSAEKYHRQAIASARLPLYKSQATRGYAVFLFTQRRFCEGRAQFEAALALVGTSNNLAHQTNGLTYQTWSWNERYLAMDEASAGQLLDKARAEYAAIDIEFLRVSLLQTLDGAPLQTPAQSAVPPRPDASAAKR